MGSPKTRKSDTTNPTDGVPSLNVEPWTVARAAWDYGIDAWQRSVLFWDTMRQRGNAYREHMAAIAPHVLKFDFTLVVDGRTLESVSSATPSPMPSDKSC